MPENIPAHHSNLVAFDKKKKICQEFTLNEINLLL